MGEVDKFRILEPARVYRAAEAQERWVVEAPVRAATPARGPHFFSGPNAQKLALRYAHEQFGGARFFPFPAGRPDVSAA